MSFRLRRTLLLAVAALPLSPAFAADYDPPIFTESPAEYTPVEVGSGWYLRGDLAYSFSRSYKDTSLSFDRAFLDATSTADFGPISPFNVISFSEKENPISGSIGFGYHFNDYLRGDLNIGLLANDKYTLSGVIGTDDVLPDSGCAVTTVTEVTYFDADGNEITPHDISTAAGRKPCAASGSLQNTAWNGMANGYIDLGTYAGITPYVGAGVGLLYTRTKLTATAQCSGDQSTISSAAARTSATITNLCAGQESFDDDPVTYTPLNYRHSEYNFMYGLSAGLSYRLTQNASLDVGYQYVSAPSISYLAVGADGVEQRKGLDSHQVKVGLRYDLW